MVKVITPVNTAADTFQVFIDRANEVINAVATEVVTVIANTVGAQTAGNGFVTGILGANVLTANTLRGGNVEATSNLAVTSNVLFTQNVWCNTTTSTVFIGNATVNAVINSTALLVGSNLSLTTVHIKIGNSTVNTTANSLGFYVNGNILAVSNAKMTVANNGTLIGSRSRINFIQGANAVLSISEDAAGGQINVTIDASLSAVPTIFIGNSTVNAVVNSDSILVGANVYLSTVRLSIGNSTVNVHANSLGFYVNNNILAVANAKMTVAGNNVLIGSRSRINFIQGANAVLTYSEDAVGGQINVTIDALGGGGGATPGGANTEVQFNVSGALGGSAAFVFNTTGNTLTLANTLSMGSNVSLNTIRLLMGNSTVNALANSLGVYLANSTTSANLNSNGLVVGTTVANSTAVSVLQQRFTNGSILQTGLTYTFEGTAANTIDSWLISTYRAAEYFYTVKDETANGYHTGRLGVISDGTDGHIVDYGLMVTNTYFGDFSATQNATHIILQFTSLATNTTIKALRTLIPV